MFQRSPGRLGSMDSFKNKNCNDFYIRKNYGPDDREMRRSRGRSDGNDPKGIQYGGDKYQYDEDRRRKLGDGCEKLVPPEV